MKHYLVTGGCGFIGSHLVEALVHAGHTVSVLDNLSTGNLKNVPPNVRVHIGDVADAAKVAKAMPGIDGVFHLAAIASVQQSVNDWPGTHRANQSGTVTMLDAARSHKLPFVYASSAAIYGDPGVGAISEQVAPAPYTAYGLDKYCCELNAGISGKMYGLRTFGLRFFNVYGPRQDPQSPYSGVISKFVEKIARREPITIFDDGEQTRDFVYAADVAACIEAALGHASAEAPVCNVGTGQGVTINALAQSLMQLAGQVEVRHAPPQEGQLRHSVADITQCRRYFPDYVPTALGAGLKTTLGL